MPSTASAPGAGITAVAPFEATTDEAVAAIGSTTVFEDGRMMPMRRIMSDDRAARCDATVHGDDRACRIARAERGQKHDQV